MLRSVAHRGVLHLFAASLGFPSWDVHLHLSRMERKHQTRQIFGGGGVRILLTVGFPFPNQKVTMCFAEGTRTWPALSLVAPGATWSLSLSLSAAASCRSQLQHPFK